MRMRARAWRRGTIAVLAIALAACPGAVTSPARHPDEINAAVFMLRFNNNPTAGGIPDYKYCVESYIEDVGLVIASASLTGMGTTSAYAYNSASRKWWDDSASRYCTQAQPVFPMNYSIFIRYLDGSTTSLARTVTSWSDPQ
ncbi:MAG: hypothetical protein ACYC7F_14145 [Gemmatimonadaceae bacterium]